MNTLHYAASTRLFVLCFLVVILLSNSADILKAEDKKSPVSFVNDVVPILTKAGCNMGICHAKAGGGQNGFQLSLLGFEPLDDYESLVKEAQGRRLFPSVPSKSLLLTKA
ncbi:MAG: S-layer protein, partial [Planctomycetaceae bacterium]|nr:S-layer protein [Planctomycetaceae bacterium]